MASSQPLMDDLDIDLDSGSDLDLDLDLDQPAWTHESHSSRRIQEIPDDSMDDTLDYRLPTPPETIPPGSILSHQPTPFSLDSDTATLEGSTSEAQAAPHNCHGNVAPRAKEISADLSEENIIGEQCTR